jgi:hypothetical protein
MIYVKIITGMDAGWQADIKESGEYSVLARGFFRAGNRARTRARTRARARTRTRKSKIGLYESLGVSTRVWPSYRYLVTPQRVLVSIQRKEAKKQRDAKGNYSRCAKTWWRSYSEERRITPIVCLFVAQLCFFALNGTYLLMKCYQIAITWSEFRGHPRNLKFEI